MHFVFWQPFPSFHQEGFLNALVREPGVDSVSLYVEELRPPQSRLNIGWREALLVGVDVQVIEEGQVPEDGADRVHVFTGFYTHKKIWSAFDRIPSDRSCRVFCYTEAPDFTGNAGTLRKWKYTWNARRLREKLDGVLAIGSVGVSFYNSLPLGKTSVIGFGYYNADSDAIASAQDKVERENVILVAGQLIKRKGVDLLISALSGMLDQEWTLRIAGAGVEQKKLEKQVKALGIEDRVEWLGVLDQQQVKQQYRMVRSLFLPSRFDGWGMTVNEALREGCPVRVSVMAGAASLVPEAWRMDPKVSSVRNVASQMLEKDATEESEMARECAKQTVGDVGIKKLMEVLEKT